LVNYFILQEETFKLQHFIQRAKLINPFNTELNPICHSLALLGAHHILHISRIRVKKVFVLYRNLVGMGNLEKPTKNLRRGMRTLGYILGQQAVKI